MSSWAPPPPDPQPIRTVAEAGSYLARVCFKHGPPTKTGLELEWLLVDPADPARRPDVATLAACWGRTVPARSPPTARPPRCRTAAWSRSNLAARSKSPPPRPGRSPS